jgi:hypothetical protein
MGPLVHELDLAMFSMSIVLIRSLSHRAPRTETSGPYPHLGELMEAGLVVAA